MNRLLADYLRNHGERECSVLQLERPHSLVLWIFRKGDAEPWAVGKIARAENGARLLRGEGAALAALQKVGQELGIPRLLLQSETGREGFLLMQSGVPGQPLSDEIRSGNERAISEQFRRIEGWLATFQDRLPSGETVATCTRQSLAACRRVLDLSDEEKALLDGLTAMLPQLEHVRAVPVHGDFWAGNVLEASTRLSVLDWGHFHYGAPTEDLHNFVAAACYRKRRTPAESGRTMWDAFFADCAVSRNGALATKRRLERWKIDLAQLRALFCVFLVNRLSLTEFTNHAAWRIFVCDYVKAGMPPPFTAVPAIAVLQPA